VKFIDWFPYYQDIRQQFGYSTEKDQEAAYSLSRIIKRKALNPKILHKKIARKRVLVIGAGPSLEQNIIFIKKSRKFAFVKIVADGAVQFLIENNIKPDIVVTDLDGNHSFLQKAEKIGALMIVHAHGDNIQILQKLVPRFRHVIGSTQVMPVKNVYNFGGFTDGDRSVFLAEEFGAKEIVLIGMDFGMHIGKYSKEVVENIELKKRKMKAGKRLIEMLAKQSRSRLFDTSKRPIRGFTAFYAYNSIMN
jgi:2-amino-4-hydroxy-6-hydroxymethyldihydropteridine diphosphokinase